MSSSPKFRPGSAADVPALLELYRAVAVQPGKLARHADEMELSHFQTIAQNALARGVWLLAEDAQGLCADIHASRPVPRDFQHVLGELTLVVHPRAQGKGLGTALFKAFLEYVQTEEPGILRIELITRDSNARARRLYEGLGFVLEGRMKSRVRHPDGRLEDDLSYAWHRGG